MSLGNINPSGSDPIGGPQPLNVGRANIQGPGTSPGTPSTDSLGTIEEPSVAPPPPLSEATSVPPPPSGNSSDREQRAAARGSIIGSFNLEAATSFLLDAVNRRHPLG